MDMSHTIRILIVALTSHMASARPFALDTEQLVVKLEAEVPRQMADERVPGLAIVHAT